MARIAQNLPRVRGLNLPVLLPPITAGRVIATKEPIPMMKTLDAISDTIRNPKHPFRRTDCRPKKAQKNRYERRKVKEYLHLGDWEEELQ
jgi:hypothetical protein